MKQHTTFDLATGEVISIEAVPDNVDPMDFLRQQVHDCPECRAARERGEGPIYIGPEELARMATELDDEELEVIETRQVRRHRERMARKRSR